LQRIALPRSKLVDGQLDIVEVRERVVAAYRAGKGTYAGIAELLWVGEASVNRWLRLAREKESLEPNPSPARSRSRTKSAERCCASCWKRTTTRRCWSWRNEANAKDSRANKLNSSVQAAPFSPYRHDTLLVEALSCTPVRQRVCSI